MLSSTDSQAECPRLHHGHVGGLAICAAHSAEGTPGYTIVLVVRCCGLFAMVSSIASVPMDVEFTDAGCGSP